MTAVAGWFGSGNFGDELLLHALLSMLDAAGCSDVVVLAADPDEVARLHLCRADHLPVLRGSTRARRKVTRDVLRKSHTLVLGPGTIFQERSDLLSWPGTLPLFARLTLSGRVSGARLVVCGAAVREGCSSAGLATLRTVGALATAVLVRDRFSAKAFGPKARVIGDLAATLPPTEPPTPEAKADEFLVSMRPLSASREAMLASTLRDAVQHVQGNFGLAGAFLPMAVGRGSAGAESDLALYERHFSDLLGCHDSHLLEAPFGQAMATWCQLLSRQRLVLATRLHAALPSVLAGVPTVAFAYERKVAETFHQIGLGDYVVGVDAPARAVVDVIARALSEAGTHDFAAAQIKAREQGRIARHAVATAMGAP
jgi:polysaccharide pyruvyl transferase WcaK-like protein